MRIEIFTNLNPEIFVILINTLIVLIYSILPNLKEKENNKNNKNKLVNNTFKALLIEINKKEKYYSNFYFISIKSFLATFMLISIIFIINIFINNFISFFFYILDNR